MAFLCPSRLGYSNRSKRVKDKAPKPKGRITGSDSIETIEDIGSDIHSYHGGIQQIEIIEDFDPKAPGEAQVTKGENCYLICTTKDWYYIERTNGQKGYVPQSVCCVLSDIDTEVSLRNSICSSRQLEYSADLSESNTDTESAVSRSMSPLFKPKRIKEETIRDTGMEVRPFYKTSHGQYIVLFDFDGYNENDVSVERAELVEVLNIEDADWSWVRKYDGLEGFVPKTYICPVEPLRMLMRSSGVSLKSEARRKHISADVHCTASSRHNRKVTSGGDLSDSQLTSDSHENSLSLTSVSDYVFDKRYENSIHGSESVLYTVSQHDKHTPSDNHETVEKIPSADIQHDHNRVPKLKDRHDGTDCFKFERDFSTKPSATNYDSSSCFQQEVGVSLKHTETDVADRRLSHKTSSGPTKPEEISDEEISDHNVSTCKLDKDASCISSDTKASGISNNMKTKSLYNYDITNGQNNSFTKFEILNENPKSCEPTICEENISASRPKDNSDIIYNAFQNVTDELATILKKRKQIVEMSSSDTTRETNYVVPSATGHKRISYSTSNFIEYVMKYEYKGQTHGQQNIYVQKGEAIYADLNAQNSSEWIWVHIPRTNQYGYIPATYADKQSTLVL